MPDEHVTDEGDPKKYWTQIPNIVFELGLKPFELVLYAHLKRAAGANANGKCTKSTPTLVRETGMGAGTVSRAKLSLQTKRSALNSKPLIRTKETRNPRGGKKRHEIVVVDIWKENMARFASSTVEIETPVEQVPQETEQVPEPSSTLEIKKNLLEEEPIQEKQKPQLVKERPPKEPDPNNEARIELIEFLQERIGPTRSVKSHIPSINFLLEVGYSTDQCKRCWDYLASQTWRTVTMKWRTVENEIAGWVKRGEPVRDIPNGRNGNNGNGKDYNSRQPSAGHAAGVRSEINTSLAGRIKRGL